MHKFKIAQFNENDSRKLRFLTDLNDAQEFVFHYDYKLKIDELCKRFIDGSKCECCDAGVKYRHRYGLYVYSVDDKRVEIIITMASDFALLPKLVEQAEANGGTLSNLDYIVDRVGYAKDTEFFVIPCAQRGDIDNESQYDYNEYGNYENMFNTVNDFFSNLKVKK